MRKIMAVVMLAGALAGCGGPRIVTGNQNTVIVNRVGSDETSGALRIADRHCAAFGKSARLNTIDRDSDQWIYDCI